MTAGGGGGGGGDDRKPPPVDPHDEAMFRAASSAGWDDEPLKPKAKELPAPPAASLPADASPPADAPPPAAPASGRAISFPAHVPSGSASVPAGAPPGTSSSRTPTLPPTSRTPTPPSGTPAVGRTPTSPPSGTASSSRTPTSPSSSTASSSRTPTSPSSASKVGIDDPALPAVPERLDENDLRAAVGASPIKSGKHRAARSDEQTAEAAGDADAADDAAEPRRSGAPRTVLYATLAAIALVGAAAVALVGYLNSDRYVLACEAARAVPEQGRSFPPWGTRPLAGDAWRPLKIAPETRCQRQETDDPQALERAFLAMVLDQVTALLTAREVTRIDDADALLKQALLLTRPAERESDAQARQRGEQHQEIERLLGDVAYWRAAAKVRDATAALGDAARQYDAAIALHPRHVTDAAAWASHVRKLVQQLQAGPGGAPPLASQVNAPTDAPPSTAAPAATATSAAPGSQTGLDSTAAGTAAPVERPTAPPGIALPVEPGRPGAPPPPSATPPDAGAPTGGVLL